MSIRHSLFHRIQAFCDVLLSVALFASIIISVHALTACSSRPSSVPASFSESSDTARIFPDYRDVVIPPNIAPMNFMVRDSLASEFVVTVADIVCGATSDGKIDIDANAWRQLLERSKGNTLQVDVYAHREQGWIHMKPFVMTVAEEPIDSFLSYRLIEPGYELYRQLGLYQRNLTDFTETPIYENNRTFDNVDNHCVNCHNYQNYSTDHMLFHVRAGHGGTIIVDGNEAHKITIKHDSIISAGVYPSWHPTQNLIAFSTNYTGQVFHMLHAEKIEVLDLGSDLLLYDVERNAVKHIIHTKDALETFPCWTPDGTRLYYCSARRTEIPKDSTNNIDFIAKYDSILYDIYSIPFDSKTRSFGEPRLEVNASGQGHSTSVPRISPDGCYMLYTQGDYGQFHIWHKSADLWVKKIQEDGSENTEEQSAYPLTAANSAEADSYHTWSSNGRWIVFASRRLDAAYSRAFIAYFDKNGQAHKAFLMPQRDPELNTFLLKSYNVPELTKNSVKVSIEKLNHVVYNTEPELATYEE